MLTRLPEWLWDAAEVQAVATRLVALLPSAPPGEVVGEAQKPHSLAPWLLCAALFAAVAFAMASGREFSLRTFVRGSHRKRAAVRTPRSQAGASFPFAQRIRVACQGFSRFSPHFVATPVHRKQ